MTQPFDIFKRLKGGSLRWKKTVVTLESARSQVKILQNSSPGSYVVLNQKTGWKTVIPQAKASELANVIRMKHSKPRHAH
jgi:hypothetical protein